jgi:hypothetical protein
MRLKELYSSSIEKKERITRRMEAVKHHQVIPGISTGATLETKKDLFLHASIVKGDHIHILSVGEDQKLSATNAIKWGTRLLSAKTKFNSMVKKLKLLIKKKKINCLWPLAFPEMTQVKVGSLIVVAPTT